MLIMHAQKLTRSGNEKEDQDRHCCRHADSVRYRDDPEFGVSEGYLPGVESSAADDSCLVDFGHSGVHRRDFVHCHPSEKEALKLGCLPCCIRSRSVLSRALSQQLKFAAVGEASAFSGIPFSS